MMLTANVIDYEKRTRIKILVCFIQISFISDFYNEIIQLKIKLC